MPRKRRAPASPRSRKSRPVKADWVYRSNQFPVNDPAGGAILSGDTLGTYEVNAFTVPSGTAAGRWLYDSKNHLVGLTRLAGAGGVPIFGSMLKAGRAEGSRPTILRTEGMIITTVSTWAVGSVKYYGWRIGDFEQVPDTGAMSLDASYSLMFNVNQTKPADWANQKNWVRERRHYQTFGDNTAGSAMHFVSWSGRRTLREDRGWGIYMEVDNLVSSNIVWRLWLRSLVVDEG